MPSENITDTKKLNSLRNESSPYLLQHASNPVDWLPWNQNAFDLAEKKDRPIFLSIGYSTCHWCHVMARECFEDPDVARIMNEHLICVKVDREERPEIDQIYMTASLLTGRPGGWPLSVFMTPGGKPFMVTTVIPKESDLGRTGMKELVPKISQAWKNSRERVLESARGIARDLEKHFSQSPGELPDSHLPEKALEYFTRNFDHTYAGFGRRPKFPSAHNLLFLLSLHKRTGNRQALDMVEKTLEAMRRGGLFDQVGYGFHRYSTDEKWILPHFEKMLYDQAMLLTAYSEAFSVTGNELFKSTGIETIEYTFRDLLSPDGGFYSAENAESEGEEGRFYLWTEQELQDALSPEEFTLAAKIFNTSPRGNHLDEATRKLTGSNVLYLSKSLNESALDMNIEPNQLLSRISSIREKLFQARSRRIRPSRDEKILCDWNALMIMGLCRAAKAFGMPSHLDQAQITARYILNNMQDRNNNLLHSLRGEHEPVKGFLDDYAFMIRALIELYQATGLESYFEQAVAFNRIMLEKFRDPLNKGLFFCEAGDPTIIVRPKDAYDGALPSGNSMVLHNLASLIRLKGNGHLQDMAREIMSAYSNAANQVPAGHTWFLDGVIEIYELMDKQTEK